MADDRDSEELQREKLMLEIEKLRQDLLAQNERLARERDEWETRKAAQTERLERERTAEARERWKLLVAGLAGGAALFGAGAAFIKLIAP